jgi:hypothetical protein
VLLEELGQLKNTITSSGIEPAKLPACSVVTPGGTEIKYHTAVWVYANDVNLLGDNINTVKKKSKVLIHACKESDLEVNTTKSMYSYICPSLCHQNARKVVT